MKVGDAVWPDFPSYRPDLWHAHSARGSGINVGEDKRCHTFMIMTGGGIGEVNIKYLVAMVH